MRVGVVVAWLVAVALASCSSGQTARSSSDGHGGAIVSDGGLLCGVFDFTRSRDVVIDVRLAHLKGRVTMNGKDLPDYALQRGSLVWMRLPAGGPSSFTGIDLGSKGPVTYSSVIAPGHYRLAFSSSSSCSPGDPSGLPCGRGDVFSDIDIHGDATMDIDLTVATVQGKVTLDGQRLPSGLSSYGSMRFDDVNGTSAPIDGATGTYTAHLLEGPHDVYFWGVGCPSAPGEEIPCNSAQLFAQRSVAGAYAMDVDLGRAHLTGSVTLDGAALPDGTTDRGSIVLRSGNLDTVLVDLGTRGAVSYDMVVLANTYEVRYRASGNCGLSPSPLPCIDGTVLPSAALQSDRSLDLEIKTAVVSGTVTLRGQPVPPGAVLGGLTFNAPFGVRTSVSLGATSQYSVRLVAGKYDVYYTTAGSSCSPSGLPCLDGVVEKGADFSSTQTFDVDLKPVTLSGNVTLNGAAMPDAAAGRGHLRFDLMDLLGTSSSSYYVTPSFGSMGPATYRIDALPGNYAVTYDPESAGCQQPDPLPDTSDPLADAFAVTSSATADFDVKTSTIKGKVTIDGAPLEPTAPLQAINLFPSPVPFTELYNSCPLGSDGFEWTVPAFDYDVYFWVTCGMQSCLYHVGCQ